MDTDAIYSAIASRIVSSKRGDHVEAEFYQDEIKRLLDEADEERKALLAENERLVDEVNEARKETSEQARLNGMGAEREARLMAENAELKAKLTEKAYLLRGCYAADHKQKQRIEELTAELERIKASPVHQFRKSRCADWFDGYPDPTDGGGPYETRTLYALGSKTDE